MDADSLRFDRLVLVIALGIDTQGRKHVLGLREGATETGSTGTAGSWGAFPNHHVSATEPVPSPIAHFSADGGEI